MPGLCLRAVDALEWSGDSLRAGVDDAELPLIEEALRLFEQAPPSASTPKRGSTMPPDPV
jgi:hypothetical protein